MEKKLAVSLDEIDRAAEEVTEKVADAYFNKAMEESSLGKDALSQENLDAMEPIRKSFSSGFRLGFSHCLMVANECLEE